MARTEEHLRQQPGPDTAPLPPHNLDAEESILGAMLLSGRAIDAIQPILQARDFYRESHGRIYRVALELHTSGTPVDAITLTDELERRGQLGQIPDGKERIHELAALVPSTGNAPHHARIVAELAGLRDVTNVGQLISNLPWDSHDADAVRARALELVQGLQERTSRNPVTVETWHEFEAQAHNHIPVLIESLWPEAAFGFIAAAPKEGKTWLALAMNIAIATGRPFLGHPVPEPRDTIYVALEGHRAALRARTGTIARGMGLDPDGDDLNKTHWIYKPPGINLADPGWARYILERAQQVNAAIVFIDVLRAAARIKENDQSEFSALRHNLEPITNAGISIAMLHHFIKLSETSKERVPGERMSGSGAMFGALDAAIYIIGSENGARKLRLKFDTRDLASPNDMSVEITGEGTGENGGYTYRDKAVFEVLTAQQVAEANVVAPAEDIHAWIIGQGGDVLAKDTRAYFDIGESTLTRRLTRLKELGVEYVGGRGTPARLTITPDTDQQLDIETPPSSTTASSAHEGTTVDEGTIPHNHAPLQEVPPSSPIRHEGTAESVDLQGESSAQVPPLFESAPARTRASAHTREGSDNDEGGNDGKGHLRPETGDRGTDQSRGPQSRDSSARDAKGEPAGSHTALHATQTTDPFQDVPSDDGATRATRTAVAETWIRDEGWMHPQDTLLETLVEKYPTLTAGDYKKLQALAASLASPDLSVEGAKPMDGGA